LKIHGKRYDYSQVNYKGTGTEVTIICDKHGIFLQRPYSHLLGCGCSKCDVISRSKTTEQFVKEAIRRHGKKYNYSKVRYINNHTDVIIICNKHGEFICGPRNFLINGICPKCRIEHITKSLSQFIKEAVGIHGRKYNYSKTRYINNHTNVVIICNKHGEFLQAPDHHLRGNGCPKCSKIILLDGTKCDSLVEAFRYLQYKKDNVRFEYNQQYGGCLGKKRYDFYLSDSKTYEEITSYDLDNSSGLNRAIKDKYLKNIDLKRKYVESVGCKFKFIQIKLTKRQRAYVFENTKDFIGIK